AVDGALLDAGLVLEVDTGLRDHVRHARHTMRAMDAPDAGPDRDPRVGSREAAPGPVGGGPPAGHGRRLAGDGDGPAGRLGAARVARVHPTGELGDDR